MKPFFKPEDFLDTNDCQNAAIVANILVKPLLLENERLRAKLEFDTAAWIRAGYTHSEESILAQNLSENLEKMGHPQVNLPVETLRKFRMHYAELAAFCAEFCDVPVNTLCTLDMFRALNKKRDEK